MRKGRFSPRLLYASLKGIDLNPMRMGRRLMGNFLEGWYAKGDEQSHNRRNVLLLNYTANVIANIIGANFFTGLLLYMNADDGFIGLMTTFTVSANLLQMIAPLLLERFEKRKRILIGIRAVIMVINIAFIGVIPLFPADHQLKLTLVGAAVLLVNTLNALYAPGLTVWHLSFTPPNMRARFFSAISMTNGIVVALAAFGAGALVDVFKAYDMELTGLLVVRGVALALAVVDIFLLIGMKEYPYERTGESLSLKKLFVSPFKEKLYLRTVAIAFMWHMTANIPGAYYTVYLLRDVQVGYSFLTAMGFLNIPILLFLTPYWSRLLRRFSWFKTLQIAMALYLAHYIMLAFVTPSNVYALYPIGLVYAYVLAVGINLSFTNIPYVNIPQQNQTVFIGFYSTMANLGALIGVTIGNQFIALTDGMSLNMPFLSMVNKQYLLLLTAALMVCAVVLIGILRKGTEDAG